MRERDSTVRTLSGLNFLFGIWLIISPYLLGYQTAQSKWQSVIAGIIVAIMSAIRYISTSQVWASWVNAVVGVWMIISPFATNYQATSAYWNQVVFGILITLVALANSRIHATTHHPAV